MSTLLSQPCPVNAVGSLLLDYINFDEADEVEAVLANTKQILNQFLRKSYIKHSHSLHFKPFKPLANYSAVLDNIEEFTSTKDYPSAMELSENPRKLALEGLDYFQTYDWTMLMTVVTLEYIGWIIHLVIHVLQSYTSLPVQILYKDAAVQPVQKLGKVYILGGLLMGPFSTILLVKHSPPLYLAYTAMTIFLWTPNLSQYQFINALLRSLQKEKFVYFIKILTYCIVSLIVLEILVNSFTERKLYTWCFLIVGIVAPLYLHCSIPWKSWIPEFVWVSCWSLSLFTLMPAKIPDNTYLV